jgi:hypothetical protein
MWRVLLCFVVAMFIPFSVGAQMQGRQVPPGAVTAGRQINSQSQSVEPPTEMRSKKINVEEVKQEAEELRKLADGIPAQIQQLTNNQLPKDLSDSLKRIEKLAKHLHSEVTP